MENWLLPDGLYDLLQEQTKKVENLRQLILAEMSTWGYEQVMPPIAEYLDSILSNTSSDLNLVTVKFQDLESGYTLGIRPDFTSQISRIDISQLGDNKINRLCYVGEVLLSHTSSNLSRAPIHIGAELFGSDDIESDLEIIQLALRIFETVACSEYVSQTIKPVLVIGQPAIFHTLLQHLNLDDNDKEELYAIFANSSQPDLENWIKNHDGLSNADLIVQLFNFKSVAKDFNQYKTKDFPNECIELFTYLNTLLELLAKSDVVNRCSPRINFDLADLRNFSYHSGLTFNIYDLNSNMCLIRGGRYDNMHSSCGKGRAATGFTLDLRKVIKLTNGKTTKNVILAPPISYTDVKLQQKIFALRQNTQIVEHELGGDVLVATDTKKYSHQLVKKNGDWILVEV